MHDVSALGVDECMINVHYYYSKLIQFCLSQWLTNIIDLAEYISSRERLSRNNTE